MVEISRTAVEAITVIASVGVVLSACEDLSMRRVYADTGLLSWSVLRVTRPRKRGLPIDKVFSPRGFISLLMAKLIAAAGLAVASAILPNSRFIPAMTVIVLGLLLVTKNRTSYGLDGADHMYMVTFLGLGVFHVMPSGSVASIAGILYIAAQSATSYFVAGVAKFRGPTWRDGSAISGIMTTKIYGNQVVATFLEGRAVLGRFVCWFVMGFEVTFVSSLVVDTRLMWSILALGVLFHTANAVLMGLNSFFFAFVSTYPAVIVANDLVHRALT